MNSWNTFIQMEKYLNPVHPKQTKQYNNDLNLRLLWLLINEHLHSKTDNPLSKESLRKTKILDIVQKGGRGSPQPNILSKKSMDMCLFCRFLNSISDHRNYKVTYQPTQYYFFSIFLVDLNFASIPALGAGGSSKF